MGTGNDLSRVLGWGKEYDSSEDPTNILQEIQIAQEVKLDRCLENIQYLVLYYFEMVL